METLTLKDIAGYLPYELPIKILNHKKDYTGIEYSRINGYYFVGGSLHVTYEGGNTGKSISEFKPILNPISCLTKETTINGKTFIPLMELSKISFPEQEWTYHNGVKRVCDELGIWFEYDVSQYSFTSWYSMIFNEVPNQYQLFQKLYEWKIDFTGLIERGLAVDATRLNNNPYS